MRGALVNPVPVYQWDLPEDIGPLQRAIREIVDGKIDVLLITSANQVHNLMEVATQNGLEEAVRRDFSSPWSCRWGRSLPKPSWRMELLPIWSLPTPRWANSSMRRLKKPKSC